MINFIILLSVVCMFFVGEAVSQTCTPTGTEQKQTQSTFQAQTGGVQNTNIASSGQPFHRQFPIPGDSPNLPPLPNYFGPLTTDGNFQELKNIIIHKKNWCRADGEALSKNSNIKSKPKFFHSYSETNQIKVVLIEPKGILVGTNVIQTKGTKDDSQQVLGIAILDGLKAGADILYITGEGASVVLKAWGAGIGINNSMTVISGGMGNVGGITTGGLGVSWGEAGYVSKPWIHVLYFKGD